MRRATLLMAGLCVTGCLDFAKAKELCEGRGDCLRTGETVELLSSVPANLATEVLTNTNVRLVFSKPMDKPSVQLVPSPTWSLGAGSWNVDDTEVTYPLTSPLVNGTTYTVTVNGRSRELGALVEGTSFSFTTVAATDVTPPQLVSSVPIDLAVSPNGVTPVATKLQLTFSEAMDRDAGVLLVSAQPSHAFGAASWSNDGTIARFDSAPSFAPNTNYTVTVDGRDVAGNALGGKKTVQFKTGDTVDLVPPTVVSTSPDAGAEMVAVGFSPQVLFSEPMSPASVTSSISLSPLLPGFACVGDATATRFTCSHTQQFAPFTEYTVTVGVGAEDGAGNNLEQAFSWKFTTGATPDTTVPTIVATSPVAGSTGAPQRPPIIVTFSEPMNTASAVGAFSISMPPTPLDGGAFSWDGGAQMVVSLPQDFAYGTDVRFRFGTGAQDEAGNPLAPNQEFTFKVRRQLTAAITPDNSGAFDDVNILSTGIVYGGTASTAVMAGDVYGSGINVDTVVKGVFSFNLGPPNVDANALTFDAASLVLQHSGDPGVPYSSNASIYLSVINVPAPGGFSGSYANAFSTAAVCTSGVSCVTANCFARRVASQATIETLNLNVLNDVRQFFNAKRVSYRMSRATDPSKAGTIGCPDLGPIANNAVDAVFVNSSAAGANKPVLNLTYTAP